MFYMLKKTRYATHFLHIKQGHRIADRKQKLVPGNGEKKTPGGGFRLHRV